MRYALAADRRRSSPSSQPRSPVATAQQAPDRSRAPRARAAAGAQAPGDSEAPALERAARLDRRAARGAGRAGEPGRAERQRRRPRRQVRRRQPDGGDAPRGRRIAVGARDRRCGGLPRRRSRAPTAAATRSAVRLHVPVARLAEALPIMADVALRPTFPNDELERLRAAAADHGDPGARRSGTIAAARVCARLVRHDPPLRHRAGGGGPDDSVADRQRRPGLSTRRSTGPTTPPSSSSATSRPIASCRCSKRTSAEWQAAGPAAQPRGAADAGNAGRAPGAIWWTNRARRNRRSGSAGSASRARRRTSSPFR